MILCKRYFHVKNDVISSDKIMSSSVVVGVHINGLTIIHNAFPFSFFFCSSVSITYNELKWKTIYLFSEHHNAMCKFHCIRYRNTGMHFECMQTTNNISTSSFWLDGFFLKFICILAGQTFNDQHFETFSYKYFDILLGSF